MEADEKIEYWAAYASKGDDESFVTLCEALKKQLFRCAKGILGNDALALEAVSEAVFRAYRGIGKLRQPQYATTWFMRILINAAKDIYKRQKHEVLLDTMPEEPHYDKHEQLGFQQLITSLSPELRVIISLKYYSEFTLEEISHILKIPVGTVKSRLNRALKQLRMEVLE